MVLADEIEYFALSYGMNVKDVQDKISVATAHIDNSFDKKDVFKDTIKELRNEIAVKFFSKIVDTIQVAKVVQNLQDDAIHLKLKQWPEELILPKYETIKGDVFKHNADVYVYIVPFKGDLAKIGTIICSRTHPAFLSKLIEYFVPEIQLGKIKINNIVREPGSRAKVAIEKTDKKINAIGTIIGKNLSRIKKIRAQIANEQIDLIEYSDDIIQYIKNSLSPARVINVEHLGDDRYRAYVANYQFSLAIGPNAQNVRLAVRLTGAKIDIKVAPSISDPTSKPSNKVGTSSGPTFKSPNKSATSSGPTFKPPQK
jgi:N utilization substance protein A